MFLAGVLKIGSDFFIALLPVLQEEVLEDWKDTVSSCSDTRIIQPFGFKQGTQVERTKFPSIIHCKPWEL